MGNGKRDRYKFPVKTSLHSNHTTETVVLPLSGKRNFKDSQSDTKLHSKS